MGNPLDIDICSKSDFREAIRNIDGQDDDEAESYLDLWLHLFYKVAATDFGLYTEVWV